jgi:putative SOS response-associated peptidase YedK
LWEQRRKQTVCGRVYVKSTIRELMNRFAPVRRADLGSLEDIRPRFNAVPGLEHPLIVHEPDHSGGMFISARWGSSPYWAKEPRAQINARCERIASSGMFRGAYRARRALMPIDGFFEWRGTRGQRGRRQPYAVAMADGKPFTLAAIWESWRRPDTGEDIRTFAVVTCPANELIAEIHDRMPVIIAPDDRSRWIGEEADPSDLMRPFPAHLMTMWPISTRVNSPSNDDPDILAPLDEGEPELPL